MRRNRLLSATVALVQTVRILNVVAVVLLVVTLLASIATRSLIEARLHVKYGAGADVPTMVAFVRLTILMALPVGAIVERLLRALRAILTTVAEGEPFAPANAVRLRSIGWMLLALQLIDLVYGSMVLVARHLKLDYTTWQPSFTGWIAVLVAFVLVRVFAAGTTMRDDLEGTV